MVYPRPRDFTAVFRPRGVVPTLLVPNRFPTSLARIPSGASQFASYDDWLDVRAGDTGRHHGGLMKTQVLLASVLALSCVGCGGSSGYGGSPSTPTTPSTGGSSNVTTI